MATTQSKQPYKLLSRHNIKRFLGLGFLQFGTLNLWPAIQFQLNDTYLWQQNKFAHRNTLYRQTRKVGKHGPSAHLVPHLFSVTGTNTKGKTDVPTVKWASLFYVTILTIINRINKDMLTTAYTSLILISVLFFAKTDLNWNKKKNVPKKFNRNNFVWIRTFCHILTSPTKEFAWMSLTLFVMSFLKNDWTYSLSCFGTRYQIMNSTYQSASSNHLRPWFLLIKLLCGALSSLT